MPNSALLMSVLRAAGLPVAIVALVAGAGAAYFALTREPDSTSRQQARQQPPPAAPQQSARLDPASEPVPEKPALRASPGDDKTPEIQAAPKPHDLVPPSFDVVRVEPNGDGVFAGQAEPGARVQLLADGEAIGEALADASGAWAIVIDKPLPRGASILWLSANLADADAVRSKDSLAIVIDPRNNAKPLAVLSSGTGPSKIVQKPEPEPEPEPARVASAEPAQSQPASSGPVEPAAPAAVPQPEQRTDAVARPEPEQPRQVASAPGAPGPEPVMSVGPVTIEAADYAPDKALHISGTAAPGARIRIYYDNLHLGDATAGSSGDWTMSSAHGLDGGVHVIRADQVSEAGGQVTARAEVSFIAQIPQAEGHAGASPPSKPAATAEQTAGLAGEQQRGDETGSVPAAGKSTASNKILVRKGDNLWRLSREHYGQGMRYTTIYTANKDQIRDPHWIYPGQVFLVPRALNGGAG